MKIRNSSFFQSLIFLPSFFSPGKIKKCSSHLSVRRTVQNFEKWKKFAGKSQSEKWGNQSVLLFKVGFDFEYMNSFTKKAQKASMRPIIFFFSPAINCMQQFPHQRQGGKFTWRNLWGAATSEGHRRAQDTGSRTLPNQRWALSSFFSYQETNFYFLHVLSGELDRGREVGYFDRPCRQVDCFLVRIRPGSNIFESHCRTANPKRPALSA